MSQIVPVPFRDDFVLTVEHNGRPYVVLRPVIESLGLDFSAQYKRLQKKSWASIAMVRPVDARDPMVTVDVRTFLMLLAGVDENRVDSAVRPALIAYQSEVADAIEQYWTRGQAVNPRPTVGELWEPHTLTWEEVCALIEQRFGIGLTVNELCRTLRTAGVLKQTGAPTKAHKALFWFTGSAWNVHPHAVKQLAMKVYTTGRELQDFRFLRARMEFDDNGPALRPSPR